MCPPVPPAMTISVGIRRTPGTHRAIEDCAAPSADLAILPVDAQQDRQGHAVGGMPEPPKLISGRVRALGGQQPMFTPMLMKDCTPIQIPMPWATSAANGTLEVTACLPDGEGALDQDREQQHTMNTPVEPELLGDHRGRKSVWASGR